MMRVVLTSQDGTKKIILGLSTGNLRRLKAGQPILIAMDELVQAWAGDVWIVAKGIMDQETRALAEVANMRTKRPQIVFGLDGEAFAKLEAVAPRKVISLKLVEPWQGMIYFVSANTEKDFLEEWAPLIGPDTVVKVDPKIL